MAKASLTLPNGTIVLVEGTIEEVRALLAFYGTAQSKSSQTQNRTRVRHSGRTAKRERTPSKDMGNDTGESDLALSQIVNLVKSCDEAEAIEKNILDRTSQVDRTLLPLYIVHKHLANARGLSSGDVSKITKDLGVPISTPNASKTLSSTAKKYVIGDRVRQIGLTVRYKLSRRGLDYIKTVIDGGSDGNAS